MLSDEWLSRYGLLENFNASVTRTRTRTGTRTGTGTGTWTWTTGVTAIALCTSCSRAKKDFTTWKYKTPWENWIKMLSELKLYGFWDACADPGGGGGGGVQIPRRGLMENFNMAKINNLAIPGGSGPPVPPLDPPMRWLLTRSRSIICCPSN